MQRPLQRLTRFLVLPAEISDFERRYLSRINRIAFIFLAMHVPVFVWIAAFNRTNPVQALILTLAVMLGPALGLLSLIGARALSVVQGVAAMFMGGLLVHFGQGPMQIEMHFYFFALVAMCVVFGNPMVIVAAAITVVLHHLVVWWVIPSSVFNYAATYGVVGVHAGFIFLESVAACFIARSFFDNVIGLERIVRARTQALDSANGEMHQLLDHLQQGIVTIDRDGALAPERSAAIDRWFGEPPALWFELLNQISPAFGASSRLAWSQVLDDLMPLELTLDQMPRRLTVKDAYYQVEYRPVGTQTPCEKFLVLVTNVTTEVRREEAELERRETMAIFERVMVDRSGFETFFEEGTHIVTALSRRDCLDLAVCQRGVHTLKGNAALYGLESVAQRCEALEDRMAELHEAPSIADCAALTERWTGLSSDVAKWLGAPTRTIELEERQMASLEQSVRAGESRDQLLRRVQLLRLEPTARRLRHFSEQAQRIAQRLNKVPMTVRIEDHDLRLDARRWGPFWAAFIHSVRNALDHGIETPEARQAAGKAPGGTLTLRTYEQAGRVVVEIADDGKGIDWNAVRERALRVGLPARSPEDLERALFSEGFSTATVEMDMSGRGVGLSALMQSTLELGGQLHIESEVGVGTSFKMTFSQGLVRTEDSPVAPFAVGAA